MLIHAAQKGDESAFETLLTRFEKPIFRYVYAILGNRADAEDVTQEVFIKLWRTLPRYRFASSFSTYLTQIAHNAALDHLRARTHRPAPLSLDAPLCDEDEQAPVLPDPDPQSDPAQAYLDAERCRMLQQALLQLPAPMRQIVTLRTQNGLSYDQIAAVLGISPGTVKSRLHRAKNFLIKLLENGNFFA